MPAANQVATARLRRPTNGRAPALIRGSPARLSVLLGHGCSLEAAAVPRQLGTKCDGSDRRRKIDEGSRRKGEGTSVMGAALRARPTCYFLEPCVPQRRCRSEQGAK